MNALHDILTTQQCAKEDRLIELREELKSIRYIIQVKEKLQGKRPATNYYKNSLESCREKETDLIRQIHILDPRSDLNNL